MVSEILQFLDFGNFAWKCLLIDAQFWWVLGADFPQIVPFIVLTPKDRPRAESRHLSHKAWISAARFELGVGTREKRSTGRDRIKVTKGLCSVLFLSLPRSEGWPHHGRTFSIYLYHLSFWLTLPQRVLSTTWCCLSRPCVVFLACVHLALFLALFLSPGNSLVSSWCDHSMLASSRWQCLTVPSLLQLCWEPTHLFSLLSTKHAESQDYISPYFGRSPTDAIYIKNCLVGDVLDVITCARFLKMKFSGLRFYRGSNFPFSYWFLNGPYNSAALLLCLRITGYCVLWWRCTMSH